MREIEDDETTLQDTFLGTTVTISILSLLRSGMVDLRLDFEWFRL